MTSRSDQILERIDERIEETRRLARDSRRRQGGGGGCLGNSIKFTFILIVLAVVVIGALAVFAPSAYDMLIRYVRGSALKAYVTVLGSQGKDALKVIAYEVDVTGEAAVNREMGGLLGLAFGEGATVRGTMKVSLGADLQNETFGILTCDIDTDSLRTSVGRAPFAGAAFDSEEIEQAAYRTFKDNAAIDAITKYWPRAQERLKQEFAVWALGLPVPEVPTLVTCPTFK